MARRRNMSPPFEVMASGRTPPPVSASGVTGDVPDHGGSLASSGDAEAPGASPGAKPGASAFGESPRGVSVPYTGRRVRSRPPLVFRVPQGLAALLVLGLVGVIILGYWVGLSQGRREGHKSGYAERVREMELDQRYGAGPRLAPDGGVSPNLATAATAGVSVPGGYPARESGRQPGLNYFVVALYPEAEALEAQQFLRRHGVETIVIPGQNTRFHEVIALRGFEGNDRSAELFRQELQRLGRIWKSQHRGPDDFSPWLRKYKGE